MSERRLWLEASRGKTAVCRRVSDTITTARGGPQEERPFSRQPPRTLCVGFAFGARVTLRMGCDTRALPRSKGGNREAVDLHRNEINGY